MFTSMGFRVNEVIGSFTFGDINMELTKKGRSQSGWDLNEAIFCHFCLVSATPVYSGQALLAWQRLLRDEEELGSSRGRRRWKRNHHRQQRLDLLQKLLRTAEPRQIFQEN